MGRRNPANCAHCSTPIYLDTNNVWRDATSDAPHPPQKCPKAATAAAPVTPNKIDTSNKTAPVEQKPLRITCTICGLFSRSALIVTRLNDDRGRCVNEKACEMRQRRKLADQQRNDPGFP